MKKLNILFAGTLLLVLGLAACKESIEPVEINKLVPYGDEYLKFNIKYPENWKLTKTPGERFIVFSADEARSRFVNYETTGFPGAMIDVYATKVSEEKTIDTLISKAKRFPDEFYKESAVTVDGVQGKRFDYTFELEDGDFQGVFIIASKDNLTYTSLRIETFAGTWTNYAKNISAIIASFKLAETQQKTQDTITSIEELPLPSDTLVAKKGTGYTISVPKNFYGGKSPTKDALASTNYVGDRRFDCNILVDVLDASKASDFKKTATELASRYPGSPAINATKVAGTDAYVMNWNPAKDVKGRVYFAKKADKLFRISINWFVPEEKDYLPIFEKSIASIKFD